MIIVNGFRLSRGHISGHRCSILCINDLLFKNCLKHVHLKDLFIALFDLDSEHGSTRSITILSSILCMNNRYLETLPPPPPREKSHQENCPLPENYPPGNMTPRKMPPGKLSPPNNCPLKNCFTKFLLLLALSYGCSF